MSELKAIFLPNTFKKRKILSSGCQSSFAKLAKFRNTTASFHGCRRLSLFSSGKASGKFVVNALPATNIN